MKRILIIDDSPLILKVSKRALESAGFAVDAVPDHSHFEPGKSAAPDLILIDINMPQFFGDDMAAYIREEWSVASPIYLFSNINEAELDKRAKACGANGYISKEWGVERLVDSVRKILGAV